MTASQLIRSIASLEKKSRAKRRGTASDGKSGVSRTSIYLENVEAVETVNYVRSHAGSVAEQHVKHSLGLSHHYLRGKLWTAIFVCQCRSVWAWLPPAAS